MAYDNGLLFLYDRDLGGDKGFDIVNNDTKPIPLPAGLPALRSGLGGLVLVRGRKRRT